MPASASSPSLMRSIVSSVERRNAVVEPSQTRGYVVRALRALRDKRQNRPPRKHGNIPL